MGTVHTSMQRHGLVRPTNGRLLAGVCAGLAHRFGIDPWAARLLFLALLLIPGSQLILYPLLWILMPSVREVSTATSDESRDLRSSTRV